MLNLTTFHLVFPGIKPFFQNSITVVLSLLSISWFCVPVAARELSVPEGFTIELVARTPLVDRPVTAAFDDQGRLYVGDSSGSNEPMETQAEERTHRIVRLEDTDGDGHFDESQIFADRMMLPEGTMFYDGSLYVAAPPNIWKLTDTNDDGVADEREEWFQGKTVTHCANDLHGPYLGPDGFIYWCKGAFAEQSHVVNGREWKTRAAHVFRARPDGSEFEPVTTGGMDNPVDVAFTPTGDRFFTSTFLVHPGDGKRDGMARAIYGGVHGKDHSVLENHPRTGDLIPVLTHMGAAAPCGLERYDFDVWGNQYRDNLFACQFNLRKVSRHILQPNGAALRTINHDFVTSHDVDFHPTDILADADGSLLVIDTGGWYKICCPTSQLEKADILGGIYRVRKTEAKVLEDPRGKRISWDNAQPERLWELLADGRPHVRERAKRAFAARQNSNKMDPFLDRLASQGDTGLGDDHTGALVRVWALGQIRDAKAQALIRGLLRHSDEEVRKTAAQAASLHRDRQAFDPLIEILRSDTPANRRIAAEALGRIGNQDAVPGLLVAAADAGDRDLGHSITYALIELANVEGLQAGIVSSHPRTQAAALIALDQVPGNHLQPGSVVPLLESPDATLKDAAHWLIKRHPDWGLELADWFQAQLASGPSLETDDGQAGIALSLEVLLAQFSTHPTIQALMAGNLTQNDLPIASRKLILRAMARARPTKSPSAWLNVLTQLTRERDRNLLALAVATARELPTPEEPDQDLDRALLDVSHDAQLPKETRVQALSVISARLPLLSPAQFDLLLESFSDDAPVNLRQAAAAAISGSRLSSPQLHRVCGLIERAGPLELNQLLDPFVHGNDDPLGLQLVLSLRESRALPALRIEILREILAKYGPPVQEGIEQLHALVNVDLESQRERIADLLPQIADGDIRRGHAVFHSSKALCSACHRLGYAGGITGPDLSRIGTIRTKQDLLESVVFPSLSFVRSYEPVVVVTTGGQAVNGLIRDDSATELLLATGPDKEVRLTKEDIDEIHPSRVSIMPAGLDKQLTVQELADLIAFLKNRGE